MPETLSELAEASGALPAPRHNSGDVPLRPMLFGLTAVVVLLAVMIGLAAALYPQSTAKRIVPAAAPPPVSPALQPSPRRDMDALRAEQRAWLDGFGWVDRTRGVVHIPIARAMADVARDGIPGWPR